MRTKGNFPPVDFSLLKNDSINFVNVQEHYCSTWWLYILAEDFINSDFAKNTYKFLFEAYDLDCKWKNQIVKLEPMKYKNSLKFEADPIYGSEISFALMKIETILDEERAVYTFKNKSKKIAIKVTHVREL
jgi:hypothetical protein